MITISILIYTYFYTLIGDQFSKQIGPVNVNLKHAPKICNISQLHSQDKITGNTG